jgi:signal transduction histidine kinase
MLTVASATSGEEASGDARDESFIEEVGGPLLDPSFEPRGPMAMNLPHHLQRLYRACIANEVSAHHTHAFRNTLGAISSSIFFVKRRLEGETLLRTDDRLAKSLDAIEARVRDAVALADSRIALPAEGATQLVLSDVVNELLAPLSTPHRVCLLGPPRSPLAVVVRRDELELALSCLIENAVEAVESKGGGTVRIGLEGTPAGCLLEILDDGLGFDPGVLEKAAQPFFSTKQGHLGMGLTVARRLVARLGGRLHLGGAAHGGVRAAFAIAELSKG